MIKDYCKHKECHLCLGEQNSKSWELRSVFSPIRGLQCFHFIFSISSTCLKKVPCTRYYPQCLLTESQKMIGSIMLSQVGPRNVNETLDNQWIFLKVLHGCRPSSLMCANYCGTLDMLRADNLKHLNVSGTVMWKWGDFFSLDALQLSHWFN